jgi:hypothetical protein
MVMPSLIFLTVICSPSEIGSFGRPTLSIIEVKEQPFTIKLVQNMNGA